MISNYRWGRNIALRAVGVSTSIPLLLILQAGRVWAASRTFGGCPILFMQCFMRGRTINCGSSRVFTHRKGDTYSWRLTAASSLKKRSVWTFQMIVKWPVKKKLSGLCRSYYKARTTTVLRLICCNTSANHVRNLVGQYVGRCGQMCLRHEPCWWDLN